MNRNLLLLVVLLLVAGLGYLMFGPDPEVADGPGGMDPRLEPGSTAADGVEGSSAAVAAAPEMEQAGRTNLNPADAGAEAGLARAAGEPGSLRLRLVDAKGQPVREVEVSLEDDDGMAFDFPGAIAFDLDHALGEDEAEEEPTTRRPDAEGWVHFAGVEAGEGHRLDISGRYWVQRRMRVAPLRAGEQRQLGEVVLSPGVALEGRVLDTGDQPVAGATVILQEDGSAFGMMGSGGATVARATSEADGSYLLPGLATGRFRLKASAPGMVEGEQVLELTPAPRDQHADLRLGAGGRVTGLVLGPDGQPMPGARVSLAAADGFASFSWRRERVLREGTEVDERGRFTLTGLPEKGRYRVLAAAEGYAMARSKAVRPGADLRLQLDPTRDFHGRVVDAGGRAVAGASVVLEPMVRQSGPGMFRTNGSTSKEDGSFTIGGVKAGDYRLRASAPAGEGVIEPVSVAAGGEPVEVVLQGGDALIVRVTDPAGRPVADASVSIHSVDDDDPLSHLGPGQGGVRIRRGGAPGGGRSGKTDAQGELRFLGLDPGPWRLEARAEGFAAAELELLRNAEDEQRAEIVVHPASALVVRVVDPFGQPVPRAQLELRATAPDSESQPRSGRADDWGIVVWEELEPGPYAVHEGGGGGSGLMSFENGDMAVHIGGPQGQETNDVPGLVVELKAGETGDETMVIASKALPRVRVTRFGEPVAGATVSLTAKGDSDFMMFAGPMGGGGTKTDGEGWAAMPPTDPGSYELSARSGPQSPPTTLDVELGAGPQDLSIALASGEISGLVIGPAGPVANARVGLSEGPGGDDGSGSQGVVMMSVAYGADEDEAAVETVDFMPGQSTLNTAADGSFHFRDVPPGDWHLRVASKGFSRLTSDTISLDNGARVDVGMLELKGAGALQGVVTGLPPKDDPEGFSMDMVQLLDADGESVQYGIVNSKGRYRFADVPPGTYTLKMQVDGEDRESAPVVVSAGPATLFDFNL